MSNKPGQVPRPTLREALPVWVKIGLLSFGGPTGQLALLHRELVEKRRWISEARFLHALNFCMVLPGPEAQQMAIYTGWLLHGIRGGILAGLLFVLPGALLIYAISILYVLYGDLPLTSALFSGVQPAVVAIVASALLRIAGKALRSPWQIAMAVGAFCLLFFANVPFPWVVLGGGILGLIFSGRLFPSRNARRNRLCWKTRNCRVPRWENPFARQCSGSGFGCFPWPQFCSGLDPNRR